MVYRHGPGGQRDCPEADGATLPSGEERIPVSRVEAVGGRFLRQNCNRSAFSPNRVKVSLSGETYMYSYRLPG